MSHKLIELPEWIDVNNRALRLGVKYGLGEKFSNIDNPTPPENYVDCSGFMRWDIWQSSSMKYRFVDGSVNQREQCQRDGFERVKYSEINTERKGRVYVAFINPVGRIAGHVWLVRNGVTWESFGGHGIGNRKATFTLLTVRCNYVFRLS